MLKLNATHLSTRYQFNMSSPYQINKKIRDAIIINLRRIFTGDTAYPYVETVGGEYDFKNTKIVISDVIPQQHAFWPAIIVDSVTGTETRYLGDDLGYIKDEDDIVETDEYFSSLELAVTLTVFTIDDTIARDELLDRVYHGLKLVIDDLATNGVVVKNTSFTGDQRTYQNDKYYIGAGIRLEIYSEWVDDQDVTDTIGKVQVTLNPQI